METYNLVFGILILDLNMDDDVLLTSLCRLQVSEILQRMTVFFSEIWKEVNENEETYY